MSAFDAFADGAFQLKKEGETIVLKFNQGVPVSGQGTVEWNIPEPADGCDSDVSAYAGMVILISQTPMTAAEIPKNGVVYHADPTGDTDMHAGDKIGSAMVVGAIYECENKGTGEAFTTELVVTDLDPNTPYYIAGYATDCQFRYHSDGQRAYSDDYGNGDKPDTPGMQVIAFGSNRILPTTGTDLVAGINYQFDVVVDRSAPTGTDFQVAQINVDGLDVGTYELLLAAINNQIKLVDNPPQSPIAPNSGAFFWDAVGEKLFQWNGAEHVEITVVTELTDPANIVDGEYWHNTENGELRLRTAGAWGATIDYINHIREPYNLTALDFWFDGTTGRSWNGSAWCDTTTSLAATDPSICEEPVNGTYWYDTVNGVLGERNTENKTWETRAAITWSEDPSNLSAGTYWFDLDTSLLNIKVAGSPSNWADQTATIAETAPAAPSNGILWYIPSTEELFTYDDTGSPNSDPWKVTPVLVWPGDPTDATSCDLWWETPANNLYAWDTQTNTFIQVVAFTMSAIDPAASPVIVVDSLWWDGTTLQKWDGSGWEAVDTIDYLTDPTIEVDGRIWYNSTDSVFSIWSSLASPLGWNVIDPVDSANDPTLLPNGVYWFDTTNGALFVRNGITWISVAYTTVPLTPTRGENWYDTVNNILYEWSGSGAYVEVAGIATAAINSRGQIVFTGAEGGSSNVVLIPTPAGSTAASLSNCGSIGTGFADDAETGLFGATCSFNTLAGEVNYPVRDILLANFLWDHLMPTAYILEPTEGFDGQSGLPSYDALGVGDDGTPDERRELADSLRAQLGYPVVDVELTPYQIDTAIQGALESLRKRSSAGYKRGFFFLDVKPGNSHYVMNNKRIGYNKIVNITAVTRFTSAFLSTAHGAGVYGQVVLQHLYNMGTYDLTSFHLVSQYVEQLEHLFATRIVFNWDEDSRALHMFQSFTRPERMLLDCSVERTEQDLLKDRYTKSWIERYALSECQFILAQIRGKYTSLPGAGGGISLNAAELTALAESNRAELMQQIDDFVVNDIEGLGQHSTFIIG